MLSTLSTGKVWYPSGCFSHSSGKLQPLHTELRFFYKLLSSFDLASICIAGQLCICFFMIIILYSTAVSLYWPTPSFKHIATHAPSPDHQCDRKRPCTKSFVRCKVVINDGSDGGWAAPLSESSWTVREILMCDVAILVCDVASALVLCEYIFSWIKGGQVE